MRLLFQTVARRGTDLYFNDRKLHELAVTARNDDWQSIHDYLAILLEIIRDLISEGRSSGAFERKTPIEELSVTVLRTLELFSHPIFLERQIDNPDGRATDIAGLVLRSLACDRTMAIC